MSTPSTPSTIEIPLMRAKVWLYAGLGAFVMLAFIAMAIWIPAPKARYATVPVAAFGLAVTLWAVRKLRDTSPKLLIDDDGLTDTRLAIGKVYFRDIAEVRAGQMHQETNRILLKLKDPEPYLRGLSWWQRFRVCPFGKHRNADVEIDTSMLDLDPDELEGLIEVMKGR